MKNILLSLLLVSSSSFACVCSNFFTPKNIENFLNKIDLIVVGTVIEPINSKNEKWIKYFWSNNNEFYNVLVKIDHNFKGNIYSEYIIVNQSNNGNCTLFFKKDRQYIISGMLTIKGHQKRISQQVLIPYRSYASLIFDFKNIHITKDWVILHTEPPTIETDSCTSMKLNKETFNLILKKTTKNL